MTDLGKCWCGSQAFFTDRVSLKNYCHGCASDVTISSNDVYLQLVDSLIPLGTGDRVDCAVAGTEPVGKGIIVEVSEDLYYGGTPVHPAYRVTLDSGEDKWFTGICLTRIHEG